MFRKNYLRRLLTEAILIITILILFRFPMSCAQQKSFEKRAAKLGLKYIKDIPLTGGTSRFDYQTIDQNRRKLFISHMGANLMTVYDLDSNKIVGNVRNIPRPTGILAVPKLNRVFVSASEANKVYVINEESLKLVGTVQTGSFPDGIAYDPEVKRVFVSCESSGVVTVFNALNNKVITNIKMGGQVGNTHFDSVSGMIFSTVQTLGELVEINPKNLSIAARYHLKRCEGPHGFYIIKKPHYAFITGEDNASYVVFDMTSKRIIARGKVGSAPDVLAYDKEFHLLYVSSESGTVSVFNIEKGKIIKTGETFFAPHAHTVSVDQKTHRVFFPLQNIDGHPILRVMTINK